MLTGLCLFDFSARQGDELSIRKDGTVYILQDLDSDDDWWLVRDPSGKRGLVPASYLKILPKSHSTPPQPQTQTQTTPTQKTPTTSQRDAEDDSEGAY
jgi:hypothetical protein